MTLNTITLNRYVSELVAVCPDISAMWLIGSRAQQTADLNSDWDFIAFGNAKALRSLRQRKALNKAMVDLLVVYDGNRFEKPWRESDGRKKKGSLRDWEWQQISDKKATYRATKFSEDSDFVRVGHAILVWPC
ncbi:MAG: hypothetical protein ACM3JG_04405 [Thiohalocapsa sp.]